jgi:hypothetical protein
LWKDDIMNNRLCAILIGTSLTLAAANVSHAMSDLASMSLDPDQRVNSETGTVVTYKVTIGRTGAGLLEAALSVQGLPEGAAASFSPNPVRFTGRVPESLSSTLTITWTNPGPMDLGAFIVTAETKREVLSVTNQPTSAANAMPLSAPLLTLDWPGLGATKVHGKGGPRLSYQIEATSDLTDPSWTPIGSSTADDTGKFDFTDDQANGSPARFYRARLQMPTGAAAAQQ